MRPRVENGGGTAPHIATVTFLAAAVEHAERADSVRRAVGSRGGVAWEASGDGASIVAVFSSLGDAVLAALDAQRHSVPPRVRVALHSAEPRVHDEANSFGDALARCERLCAIARGGQTLLSRAVRERMTDQQLEGIEIIDNGFHRLSDLGDLERIYQLRHPDVALVTATLQSRDAVPNNLPDQPTSFIGRDRELRNIADVLEATRMLTLTGPGGCGKTRLALEATVSVLDRFPDGAWWVGLAQLEEPSLFGQAVARTMGVRPLSGQSPLAAATGHLATRRAIVVLDNCEHVRERAAETARALLADCPGVTVLATSRIALGLPAETRWRVPPLSLPAAGEEAGESDAVRLFVSRALDSRPSFRVVRDDASTIVRICSELDGIPLAIELAAARVRMLSLEQITEGLGNRFRLLTAATGAELPHQQTLRASVDWSHGLLAERARVLFRRLAHFRGGFTLDAAERVAVAGGLERASFLGDLASLVDSSLVVAEERGSAVRYRLLETVRQYALDRLVEAGESEPVADRHRDVFLDLAERVGPRVVTSDQAKSLERLDAESANLSLALDRAVETDPERALRFCLALTRWWRLRGLFAASERAFGRALDAGEQRPSSLRARVLWGRGYLLTFAGEYEDAVATTQEALSMAEFVGDDIAVARALHVLGQIRIFPDPVGSRHLLERSRTLARGGGDEYFYVAATQVLAQSHQICDEFEQARQLFDEVLPVVKGEGYRGLFAFRCLGLSVEALMRGDGARLFEFAEEALVAAREVGEPVTEGLAHVLMAMFELAHGRPEPAIARLEQSRERMTSKGAGMALHYTDTVLGAAHASLARYGQARAFLERVIETAADSGYWLSWTIAQLADVLRVSGDPEGAAHRAHEALAIAERVQSPAIVAWCEEILGRLTASDGDWGESERLLHEALARRLDRKLWLWLPQTCDALAEVAAGLESHEEAARLLGAADGGRAGLGLVRWQPDVPRFTALEEALRSVLGDDRFESARAEGAQLSLEEAAGWVRRARGSRKRPSGGWESLTPTELDVARHAATGLTNPQIGARMFISRGTVKVHLSHIYAKLGVQNRAELAAQAARRMPVRPS